MSLDMQQRLKNVFFWLGVAGLVKLGLTAYGVTLPPNYEEIVNTVACLLVTGGVLVDPTTSGLFDLPKKKLE